MRFGAWSTFPLPPLEGEGKGEGGPVKIPPHRSLSPNGGEAKMNMRRGKNFGLGLNEAKQGTTRIARLCSLTKEERHGPQSTARPYSDFVGA